VRFLKTQPPEVCSSLIDNVVWLAHNPSIAPDDTLRRPFFANPVFFTKYEDDTHWIIYDPTNGLMVANIGIRGERQLLHRPE
jgi:hypothetical protein